ncbi:MAG TPA: type II toxin-antitoxin system PemK/MazF family toxin [Spirochaetia bacterium]|nr:type II toxin-antitoxin system PemK/MazF family toxin [Spirochaetia bacterium]
MGTWAAKNPSLYPRLPQGAGKLPKTSVALLDQVRALDTTRITGYVGSLKGEEYALCQLGIKQLFRL